MVVDKQVVQDKVKQAGQLGALALTLRAGQIVNVMTQEIGAVGDDRVVISVAEEVDGDVKMKEVEIFFVDVVAVNAFPD